MSSGRGRTRTWLPLRLAVSPAHWQASDSDSELTEPTGLGCHDNKILAPKFMVAFCSHIQPRYTYVHPS